MSSWVNGNWLTRNDIEQFGIVSLRTPSTMEEERKGKKEEHKILED